MRTLLICLALLLSSAAEAHVDFDTYFDGRTLRIDYTFAGDSASQQIFLDRCYSLDLWAGRRVNLDKLYLEGTADITMRTVDTGKIIYRHSFSTHFQDWTGIKQATALRCAYDHVVTVPMPRNPTEVEINLYDFRQKPVASLVHKVDPKDILIRNLSASTINPPSKYILHSGDSKECIDVAILAEGYDKDELQKFYDDAKRFTDALFSYEPFKSNVNKFNVIAVGSVSAQSGISEPAKGIWKQTAINSCFNFLYMDRLLGVPSLRKANDLLASVDYEHILILANTDTYGGCGVYNSYCITAAHNVNAIPVTVHEFAHEFGGLGDEYFYDDTYTQYYYPDVEPWNENLTTLADFKRKWADMLPAGATIPAKPEDVAKLDKNDVTTIGVYEGGGYQSKGVYRPAVNCRMRTNSVPDFCPVCKRALNRMIDYHITETEPATPSL
ncbi:MAG: M64 family metallopeptidase [Bacteroidaceae bacterium]|nr:M64 family metallopeptidase [Prevotellaceae bacterium]MDY2850040.1 M64 family metallopeptidase [Bacteroidaceae bacterium]